MLSFVEKSGIDPDPKPESGGKIMKKGSVLVLILAAMIVWSTPAFAFNYVKNFIDYRDAGAVPEEATLTQQVMQYIGDLMQNRDDFLASHPGATNADYQNARNVALACNIPASGADQSTSIVAARLAGYLSDGHDGTYFADPLKGNLNFNIWENIGFRNCARTADYRIEYRPIVGIGAEARLGEPIPVNISFHLTNGNFFAEVFREHYPDGGSDYIRPRHQIRTMDALLARLETLLQSSDPQVDPHVRIRLTAQEGIIQQDPTFPAGNFNMAWMQYLAGGARIITDDWMAGTGDTANVMYIDPLVHDAYSVTRQYYLGIAQDADYRTPVVAEVRQEFVDDGLTADEITARLATESVQDDIDGRIATRRQAAIAAVPGSPTRDLGVFPSPDPVALVQLRNMLVGTVHSYAFRITYLVAVSDDPATTTVDESAPARYTIESPGLATQSFTSIVQATRYLLTVGDFG